MTEFTCLRCETTEDDVRLVEHGTDDVPLCKSCFKQLARDAEDHDPREFEKYVNVFGRDTATAFPVEELKVADKIAALAIEGVIPKDRLPTIGNIIGYEKAGLVASAMEGVDD